MRKRSKSIWPTAQSNRLILSWLKEIYHECQKGEAASVELIAERALIMERATWIGNTLSHITEHKELILWWLAQIDRECKKPAGAMTLTVIMERAHRIEQVIHGVLPSAVADLERTIMAAAK
jgi:hypothetical protein